MAIFEHRVAYDHDVAEEILPFLEGHAEEAMEAAGVAKLGITDPAQEIELYDTWRGFSHEEGEV